MPSDPNIDLHSVDFLLNKADALLRRHKTPPPAPQKPEEEEDIPILTDFIDEEQTEVNDHFQEDPLEQPILAALATNPFAEEAKESDFVVEEAITLAAIAPDNTIALMEQFLGMEAEIARQVDNWFAVEFPPILAQELNQLSERLRQELQAHVRATLLPALSECVSENLAKIASLQDK